MTTSAVDWLLEHGYEPLGSVWTHGGHEVDAAGILQEFIDEQAKEEEG